MTTRKLQFDTAQAVERTDTSFRRDDFRNRLSGKA